MTTATNSKTPFAPQGDYSGPAIELMRAMSAQRQNAQQASSSPEQIVRVLSGLGYESSSDDSSFESLTLEFLQEMGRYQRTEQVAHPTCEDVIKVIGQIGWTRSAECEVDAAGLPIDRRRSAVEARAEGERRSSTELSPQQKLDLTEQENRLLDELSELRNSTGRDFASSEELLNIIWTLGYRPVKEDGVPQTWLDADERVRLQAAFSHKVETRVANCGEGEFLTCRDVLQVAEELGFSEQ